MADRPVRLRSAVWLAVAGVGLAPLLAYGSGAPPRPAIDAPRELYLLRCAGCHGIQGVSIPKAVPTLRGRVGAFLCSDAGRNYVLRLPNIQMSLIRDDDALAAVMNFVAFDLGGASAPPKARPFTAREVAAARNRPLPTAALAATRKAVLDAAGGCATAYRTAAETPFLGPY